jgi:6-phosphogluconate dehydrogenase
VNKTPFAMTITADFRDIDYASNDFMRNPFTAKYSTKLFLQKIMAKTQGFYKIVRASAVTHRKLQISKVVTPPIPD